jgi:hypothetical protein
MQWSLALYFDGSQANTVRYAKCEVRQHAVGASLKNSVKTWLVGTWSIKLDENAGSWRYQTRGANTKLGGSDDPDGLPEEPASRDHTQEARTWDTGTHIRKASLYELPCKF